jgi:broad specificity phosphatase PhoE
LPALGLIDRAYETDDAFDPRREKHPWERFTHYLDCLNKSSRGDTVYKLLFAARHGEGYHNVKEAEVGTAEWEVRSYTLLDAPLASPPLMRKPQSHWAKLDGDGKIIWADAHLTPLGKSQALAMNAFWAHAASTLKLPLPTRHYASPLARCLETCELAFSGLALSRPFEPIIKELIRERLGIHTCDRRRTRTWILDNHPGFETEMGFLEQDALWRPDVRETLEEHAGRVTVFLDDLFANESAPIVSVTAHSGTILALYEAIGHAEVRLEPGAIIPVLVKAETTSEE